MKYAISRGILAAVFLLSPLAPFAETFTYYDCVNEDGSISYRVFPCSKRQQEISRQKNTPGVKGNQDTDARSAAARQPARAISTPEANAQQNFAAGEAAYMLGSYEEAASWYRKAAEQGVVPAQFSMGVMYDIGRGVAQDYQQAMFWYGNAAENGDVKAQNNLGFMYSQGKGVAQSYVIAHMWFNISAVRGYEEGRKNREFVEKLMTGPEIAEAQKMAGEWMNMHPLEPAPSFDSGTFK